MLTTVTVDTMRAWILNDTDGPDSFSLDEVDTPEPGPGDVRVRIVMSGLNHLDLWVSQGLPAPGSFPHVAGGDAAGVVDSVGEGVDGWSAGDEVIVDPTVSCGKCEQCLHDDATYCADFSILGEHRWGTLAEYVVVPARNLRPKFADLSWEVAGTFGLVTGTAYRMLKRARLRRGDTVLVVGIGGGVSSMAFLVAKALGARVWVTSRSPEKITWATESGAEGGFDSSADFSKEAKEVTNGGVDIVIENVGPATWNQSIRSMRKGGRMAVCGGTTGSKVELSLPALFFKQLEIIGSSMATHSQFARALHMVESGDVVVPIDSVHDFEDVPAAIERLDSGEHMGKVAIRR